MFFLRSIGYVQKLTIRAQRARAAPGASGMTPDGSPVILDHSGVPWRGPAALPGLLRSPRGPRSFSEASEASLGCQGLPPLRASQASKSHENQ